MLASPGAPSQETLDVKRRIISNFPRASAVARAVGWLPHGGQNLADSSTMKVVNARKVSDGFTCKISSYQPRLFLSVQVNLALPRAR